MSAAAEAIIAEIWQGLFGVAPNPDANFFDLGGDSLLVARMVAQAREAGLSLDPVMVFENPTVGGLAARIADEEPRVSVTSFAAVWEEGRETISPRPPRHLGGEGEETPFFCVHWGTGNVSFLAETVALAGFGRRFYGFEAVGLRERERPLLSVAEMASLYLRGLRALQPEGPYLLGGLCSGGLVAFEMARQLRELGQGTALVVAVNAGAPGEVEGMAPGWGLEQLYDFRVGSIFKGADGARRRDMDEVIGDLVGRGHLDPDVPAGDLYWLQVVWSAAVFAQMHYRTSRHDGRVVLINSSGHDAAAEVDAWHRHVERPVEAHEIVGGAATVDLLRDPLFARRLATTLHDADPARRHAGGSQSDGTTATRTSRNPPQAADCLVPWNDPVSPRFGMVAIPHAGAGAAGFRSWGAAMPDVAVYGVRFAGRESRLAEAPKTQLPELVDELRAAIEARMSDLPLLIFGQCSGAVIGFEVARCLQRKDGVRVAHLYVCGQMSPRRIAEELSGAEENGDVEQRLRALGGVPDEIWDEPDMLNLLLPAAKADFAVLDAYRYRAADAPLECPVTVILGKDDDQVDRSSAGDWKTETTGAFRLRLVPGGHLPDPQGLALAISEDVESPARS